MIENTTALFQKPLVLKGDYMTKKIQIPRYIMVGLNERSQEHISLGLKVQVGEFNAGSFANFLDIFYLHSYLLPSGELFYENVQTIPLSFAGPVFFLGLQNRQRLWLRQFTWEREEIEEVLKDICAKRIIY